MKSVRSCNDNANQLNHTNHTMVMVSALYGEHVFQSMVLAWIKCFQLTQPPFWVLFSAETLHSFS